MPMTRGVYVTRSEIKGTARVLEYYRRFLESGREQCVNPEFVMRTGIRCVDLLSKEEARKRIEHIENRGLLSGRARFTGDHEYWKEIIDRSDRECGTLVSL